MIYNKEKIDLLLILNATYRSKTIAERYIEKVNNYNNDPNKNERLKYHYCKTCFYILDHIGGAMVITEKCKICKKEIIFGSTNTDFLCFDCAKKHKLCAHCCGTINQKQRRKFDENH